MVDVSRVVWKKSTRSGTNGCVEVAFLGAQVAVRDSKDREGPMLFFTPAEWDAFIDGVRHGELGLP